MKTIKLSALLLIAGTLSMTSCKKKGCMDEDASNYNASAKKEDNSCVYAPVITIVGANPAAVSVGATYSDAGATAFVKKEGAVDVTTDLSQVNTSQTGSFNVIYTASNSQGTTTATRVVNVVLGQSAYIGSYTTTNDCDAIGFPHVEDAVVEVGSNENQVLINDAFTLLGGTIVINISGENITVPPTSIPIEAFGISIGTLDFSGTGTMNATGTQMTINYDWARTGQLEDQGFCTVIYNK